MKTPTTKAELLNQIQSKFNQLHQLIDDLPEQEKHESFRFNYTMRPNWRQDQSVSDILIHLYERANRLSNWIEANREHISRPFRIEIFGDMSNEMRIVSQNTTFDIALQLAEGAHMRAMNLLENLSEDELFKANYFSWKKQLSIADYAISGLSSHYEWLKQQIENHLIAKTKNIA